MKIEMLLAELLARGICLSTVDRNLHINGNIKPSTESYIQHHKQEIIEALSVYEHGACVHCGVDTSAMLTVPHVGCAWCRPDCFDKRDSKQATAESEQRWISMAVTGKVVAGDSMRPI